MNLTLHIETFCARFSGTKPFFFTVVFFLFTLLFPLKIIAGGGEEPAINHWERPFIVSGNLVDPNPQSCKGCHSAQYDSWSRSLHSRSMSPGLLMQIEGNIAPAFVKSCKFCHAPAMEQSKDIEADSATITNRDYDEKLAKSGVSCAVCHLRGGEVYGPPGTADIAGVAPHEITTTPLFESSEFCAACHQMDLGFELNGKVLTNTYREWKESPYAKKNITCQKCHMPDRRHEFRGIHDATMVRGGLDIKLLRVPAAKGVKASLSIKNARVGHMFPTYVTPIVVVKAYQTDADGKEIEGSVEKGFIGRLISQDLSIEYFDTRLAPFQSYVLEYDTATREVPEAKKLVFEVTVRPDEFYDRMFKRAIEHGNTGFVEEHLIEAERRTDSSSYELFREEILIGD